MRGERGDEHDGRDETHWGPAGNGTPVCVDTGLKVTDESVSNQPCDRRKSEGFVRCLAPLSAHKPCIGKGRMRSRPARLALCGALLVCVAGARAQARNDDRDDRSVSNTAALHELLEGSKGRREAWKTSPVLVIVTSVMDYASGDLMSGYSATDERLTDKERIALAADLTHALGELTGGQLKAFSEIRVESAPAGQIVKVLRPGQIVAGRFRGVQAKTGSLGYGSRMTRDGRITAGAVIVDCDADRDKKKQAVIRTHELGHALGYNHVESRPSIMNPRAGGGITDFDRVAVKVAYLRPLIN